MIHKGFEVPEEFKDLFVKFGEGRKADREAEEELVKEGFPLEGGTVYPPEDFPRTKPVSPQLRRRVLQALLRRGYSLEGSGDVWEDPSTGIQILFNIAPLMRHVREGDEEEEGWGRIFINAFDRVQEVGEARARLEAGRLSRIIKGVPGIKGKHFVGVVLCEGL